MVDLPTPPLQLAHATTFLTPTWFRIWGFVSKAEGVGLRIKGVVRCELYVVRCELCVVRCALAVVQALPGVWCLVSRV